MKKQLRYMYKEIFWGKPVILAIFISIPIMIGISFCIDQSQIQASNSNSFTTYLPTIYGPTVEYSVVELENGEITEYRFYCDDHHFMTWVDDGGTFNLRPHPGIDPNGWGSSLYAQPFLPNATLKHTVQNNITSNKNTGISIDVSGQVSRQNSLTFGSWDMQLTVFCNRNSKEIIGNGLYTISLDEPLSTISQDLNLYRIASNYLDNVPLQSGGFGDTGDMQTAEVQGGENGEDYSFSWNPAALQAHFPTDLSNYLKISVIGDCNDVDTEAQGLGFQIQPAYKPTVEVTLISENMGIGMSFGGLYDVTQNQRFESDNVGITPLILKETTATEFQFDIQLRSVALPGDGNPTCS